MPNNNETGDRGNQGPENGSNKRYPYAAFYDLTLSPHLGYTFGDGPESFRALYGNEDFPDLVVDMYLRWRKLFKDAKTPGIIDLLSKSEWDHMYTWINVLIEHSSRRDMNPVYRMMPKPPIVLLFVENQLPRVAREYHSFGTTSDMIMQVLNEHVGPGKLFESVDLEFKRMDIPRTDRFGVTRYIEEKAGFICICYNQHNQADWWKRYSYLAATLIQNQYRKLPWVS